MFLFIVNIFTRFYSSLLFKDAISAMAIMSVGFRYSIDYTSES